MSQPKPMADVLGKVLSGLQQQERDNQISVLALQPLWKRAVGDFPAKHSAPVKVRGRMLFIVVDSPALAEQLLHMAPALLERLSIYARRTFASLHIERIGPLPKSMRSAENASDSSAGGSGSVSDLEAQAASEALTPELNDSLKNLPVNLRQHIENAIKLRQAGQKAPEAVPSPMRVKLS